MDPDYWKAQLGLLPSEAHFKPFPKFFNPNWTHIRLFDSSGVILNICTLYGRLGVSSGSRVEENRTHWMDMYGQIAYTFFIRLTPNSLYTNISFSQFLPLTFEASQCTPGCDKGDYLNLPKAQAHTCDLHIHASIHHFIVAFESIFDYINDSDLSRIVSLPCEFIYIHTYFDESTKQNYSLHSKQKLIWRRLHAGFNLSTL